MLPTARIFGLALLAACALTSTARADAVEDFYKGKTITLFVGAGVGGSYEAVALISSAAEFGRAVFTTPDVPADRLAALRRAFDAAVRDPELLAEAAKRQMPIEPQSGEALQKIAAQVTKAFPEAVTYARELQGSK